MRLCQDMQNSDSNQFKCVFAHEERFQKKTFPFEYVYAKIYAKI